MNRLELRFYGGETSLSVRRFEVREAISELFEVVVLARSADPGIDLESIVGAPASLRVESPKGERIWAGVCRAMELGEAEPSGLSTYTLTIVPALWALTQRRNSRIFQHLSVPEIAEALLDEWGIKSEWRVDRSACPKLEMRVQYEESDYAFLCRLLEEAGISFTFENHPEQGTALVLHDRPNAEPPRVLAPIPFVASVGQAQAGGISYVTDVEIGGEVRHGRVTVRDYDFRRPAFTLELHAEVEGPERALEHYDYLPGAFLIEKNPGIGSTLADDKGIARHNVEAGRALAKRTLRATREGRRLVRFATNVMDLGAGAVFAMAHHPRTELAPEHALLVTEFTIEGEANGEWTLRGTAVLARKTYRPAMVTPRPRIAGVQSALVVGPLGQEVYTDEYGRVRVQFPWDRYGASDPNSSSWIRVSQGWAGPGYGAMSVPRVGDEVLVSFTEGNPDHPMVVGALFNGASPPPYKLPEHKTVSTWKGRSTPGGDGSNEIRFEDAKGHEQIYVQAEKDFAARAKRDEAAVVGEDRTQLVRRHAVADIGHDRTRAVLGDEVEAFRGNRYVTVGTELRAETGGREVSDVGGMFLVKVIPILEELLGAPPPENESSEPPPQDWESTNAEDVATTGLVIAQQKIVLGTRGSTIVLDGPNITVTSDFIVAAPTVAEADAFKLAALAAQEAARQAAAEAAARKVSLDLGAAPENLPPDPVRMVIKDPSGKVLQELTIDRNRLSSSLSPGLLQFLRSGDPVEMYTDRDYAGANVGAVLANLGPGAILQNASGQSSAGGAGAGAAAGAPSNAAHIVLLDAEGNPKRTVKFDRNRLSTTLSPALSNFLRTGEPVQMRMDQLYDGVPVEGVLANLGPGAVLEDTPFVQKIDEDTFRTYRDADVRLLIEFNDHLGEGKYYRPEEKTVATVYVNFDKVPADLRSLFPDEATTLDVNKTHNGMPYRDLYKKLVEAGAVVAYIERPEPNYDDDAPTPSANELLFVANPNNTPGWNRHRDKAMESKDLAEWQRNGAPQASWTYEAGIISTNNEEGTTRKHVFTGNFSQLSKQGLLVDGHKFEGESHWAGADNQIYVLSSDVRTEGGLIHVSNMNNTTDGPFGFVQVDGLVLQPGGQMYVTLSEKNAPARNGLEILAEHGQAPPQPPRDFWIQGRDSDGGRRRFVHFDANGNVLAELSYGEMLGFSSSYVPTDQLSLSAEQLTRVEGISGKLRDPIQTGEFFSTLKQVLGLVSAPLSVLVPGSGLFTGAFLAVMSGDPLQMTFAALSAIGAAAAAPGGLPDVGANFGNYVSAARNAYTLATTDNKLPALLNFVGSAVNLDAQNPLTSSFFSAAADVMSGIQNPSFETLLNAVTGIAAYAKAIEKKLGSEAAKQALKDEQFRQAIGKLVAEGKYEMLQFGTTNVALPGFLANPVAGVPDWRDFMGQFDARGGTMRFAGATDNDIKYVVSGASGDDLGLLSGGAPGSDPLSPTANPSTTLPGGGEGLNVSTFYKDLDAGKIELSLTPGPKLGPLFQSLGGNGGVLFNREIFLEALTGTPLTSFEGALARVQQAPRKPLTILSYPDSTARDYILEEAVAAARRYIDDPFSRPRGPTPTFDNGSVNPEYAVMVSVPGAANTGLPQAMARLGSEGGLDFRLLGLTDPSGGDAYRAAFFAGLTPEAAANVTFTMAPVSGELDYEIWSRDYMALGGGGVTTSWPVDPANVKAIADRAARLRFESIYGMKAPSDYTPYKYREEFPLAYTEQGMSIPAGKTYETAATFAFNTGQPLYVSLIYSEGGNMGMTQNKNGERVLIVGDDTVFLTMAMWEVEFGKTITQDDAIGLIAQTYGLEKSQVVQTQQTGFHNDMRMMLLPNGKIIVNDSEAASNTVFDAMRKDMEAKMPDARDYGNTPSAQQRFQQDMNKWQKDYNDMNAKIKASETLVPDHKAREDLQAQQLSAAGFDVIRVGGAWDDPRAPSDSVGPNTINFINSMQGTTNDGKPFIIALGGPPEAERAFVEKMIQIDPNIQVVFTPRELTPKTLSGKGGIRCRTWFWEVG